MLRVARLGEISRSGGVMIPPPVAEATINAGASSCLFSASGAKIVAPAGATYAPTMTAANAPAPYSVTDGSGEPSTYPWTTAAWQGVKTSGVQGRAFQVYYAADYDTPPAGAPTIPVGSNTLNTPIWFVHAGPARKYARYVIRPAFGGRNPVGWKLQGAQGAGGPWTDLDVRTGLTSGWTASVDRVFDIGSPGTYTHYRLWFTQAMTVASAQANYIDVEAFRFLEAAETWQAQSIATKSLSTSWARASLIVRVASDGGSVAPNVNIVGKLSRDNGATFKTVALKSQRVLGDGSVILSALDVSLASIAAGENIVSRVEATDNRLALLGWIWGAIL